MFSPQINRAHCGAELAARLAATNPTMSDGKSKKPSLAADLLQDLQSGIAITCVSVPSAIAYAELAGLPGVNGLTRVSHSATTPRRARCQPPPPLPTRAR